MAKKKPPVDPTASLSPVPKSEEDLTNFLLDQLDPKGETAGVVAETWKEFIPEEELLSREEEAITGKPRKNPTETEKPSVKPELVEAYSSLAPKWSRYMPDQIKRSAKQMGFLSLPHLEAMYGGTAGCGKSWALSAAALQWFDHPKYSGIILRENMTDARRNEGVFQVIYSWLKPYIDKGTVKYRDNKFISEEGACLEFGFLSTGYQESFRGAQYHFIGIDELPQHLFPVYEYWYHRCRRGEGGFDIPLRIRATGNPGGRGDKWIMNHWKLKKIEVEGETDDFGNPLTRWVSKHRDRAFLEASWKDNPGLDVESYKETMENLSAVTYLQMAEGDWGAAKGARYQESDFIYTYEREIDPTNKMLSWHLLNPDGEIERSHIRLDDFTRIATTVDVAASTREGIAGTIFKESTKNKTYEPAWSVIATWGLYRGWVFLLDIVRMQSETPEVVQAICRSQQRWKRGRLFIEKDGVGNAVCAEVQRKGFDVNPVKVRGRGDKLTRATEAFRFAHEHRFVLPQQSTWLADYKDEIFSWTGAPEEVDDQIDVTSMIGFLWGDYVIDDSPTETPWGINNHEILKKRNYYGQPLPVELQLQLDSGIHIPQQYESPVFAYQ